MANQLNQSLVFTVGDFKPASIVNVVSPTSSALSSATYTLFNRATPSAPIVTAGTATTAGATASTPNRAWNTVGDFIIQWSLTFADGIIDTGYQSIIRVRAAAY